MTPEQLDLIIRDSELLADAPERFATAFYETLFELAPETRALFPDDLAVQRTKLTGELLALVDIATAWHMEGALDGFVERATDLGARHRGFGVTGSMYAPVGVALVAGLRTCVDGFDAAHEQAWSTLYRLVAETMRDGARGVSA